MKELDLLLASMKHSILSLKESRWMFHVLYFDESKQQVIRLYIGSTFMGHATAEQIYKHFKKVHGDLDVTHSLIQISMDGPNVIF